MGWFVGLSIPPNSIHPLSVTAVKTSALSIQSIADETRQSESANSIPLRWDQSPAGTSRLGSNLVSLDRTKAVRGQENDSSLGDLRMACTSIFAKPEDSVPTPVMDDLTG